MFYHLSCAQSLRGSPINDDEYCVLTNYRDHNYRELVRVIGKPYRNDDDDICGYTKADRIIPYIDNVNDVKNKVNGSDSSDYDRKIELVQSQQKRQQQHKKYRNTDKNNDETIDNIDDDDDCDLHYYLSHSFSTCRLYSLQVGVQGNVVHHHHHHNNVL